MSNHILKDQFRFPLEREFEAWIVRGIKDYFRSIDVKAFIFAISPSEETKWPSDEKLDITEYGKIIGLQFKRPTIDETKPLSYEALKWNLSDSKRKQYDLVKAHKEIFYVLPTFVNRKWEERALEHCIFWRPNEEDTSKIVWYDNKHINTKISLSERSCKFRWGEFLEQIMECNIGQKINQESSKDDSKRIELYLKGLKKEFEYTNQVNDGDTLLENQVDSPVYFIFIPGELLRIEY